MDGVFMKKLIKITLCISVVAAMFWLADVWQDKQVLQENLIRLHVVANSDSDEDQKIKLQVKDAVVSYLQAETSEFENKEQAMQYINDNLTSIEEIANRRLSELGNVEQVAISLGPEVFDTRDYETFSLPAGIYDSLRIQIGEGKGKNWWCVVFPSLCLPATTNEFQEVAVSSGFSQELGSTLSGDRKFRFFVLDCFGKIEKFFQ